MKLQEFIIKKYHIKNQSSYHSYYPSAKNLSDILFSSKKTELPERGLMYPYH